jgi:hypothetical protein
MRVMKDGACGDGKLILAIHAFIQMAGLAGLAFGAKLGDAMTLTLQTPHALRPTDLCEMGDAGFFRAELVENLK